MSVVAALSAWLVHANRRRGGSWTQRYEHGVPVTDLVAVADDGTTVRFRPDDSLAPVGVLVVDAWPHLRVVVDDRRG